MTRTEIYEQVQRLIAEQDLFAASAFVLGLDETQAVAEAFENLVLDCYHVAKSIAQVLHFGSAGIHFCLAPVRISSRRQRRRCRQSAPLRGQAHGNQRRLFHVARLG